MNIKKQKDILIINGGSSSIKFALFDAALVTKKKLSGKIERIGLPDCQFSYHDLLKDKTGTLPMDKSPVSFLLGWLEEYIDMETISAIGHRVVHGMKYTEPQPVSKELINELHSISGYDPDHLPMEIEIIERFNKKYPDLKQVVCFDTSFHTTMPRVAKLLPLPRRYDAMGIQRYGFHGISCLYLMEALTHIADTKTAKGKIILAHLGNGASLTAVKDGKSIDTRGFYANLWFGNGNTNWRS